MRTGWTDLPHRLRDEIEDRAGPVVRVEPAAQGNHADIASTVDTANGRLFVKAARKAGPDEDGPEVRSLRWEAAINPYVTEYAPRLLWTAEAEGWLAVGFEHVTGRHGDYRPGSPDLELLAKVIDTLQNTECPTVLSNKRVERRWGAVIQDATPMAGDALLHADLNPANLLITEDGSACLVDWAFACRGARWVELGLLIPWLLKSGHGIDDAEQWVARFQSWSHADPKHIDLLAAAVAAKWQINIRTNQAPWALEHAEATQRWADHRA